MAVIQLLHMMICAPSNYTFLVLKEREREKKLVVILKSPLDAGLIIVCLVFGMAVIETLAVRVYIQHVGGSRAPCGWILIISLDHKQLHFFSLFSCSPVSTPSQFHFPLACVFGSKIRRFRVYFHSNLYGCKIFFFFWKHNYSVVHQAEGDS